MNDLTNTADLAVLMEQMKAISENITGADAATNAQLDELKKKFGLADTKMVQVSKDVVALVEKQHELETSVNDLHRRVGRPGGGEGSDQETAERKEAVEILKTQYENKVAKKDILHPFNPTEDQIKSALIYRKALTAAIHTIDHTQLTDEFRKSLSAFSFGTNSFMLAPEMTNRVLSCIVYPSDLGGLFDSMTTSSPSVRFLIDNPRMSLGGWACEASCFANNPQPDLQEGIGELEIKPETLRMVVCVTRDLIEDASINVETWIMDKAGAGMRATINNTLILGDGVGKPMGVLNPRSGIPICETALATPAGSLTWQDLYMLKYEIPMQWLDGGSYLMNQRTWAQIMTMSDASGRPLWSHAPAGAPGFQLAGSPVHIVTQMPDIMPGSTPVAFGNWKKVFMIVWRKAVTMTTDPYTAGFCVLYKFEARVGGGILCPNAARLLRIR